MWFERFNIVVQSLAREFDPYAWGSYNFSWTEMGMTIGSFGWFFTLLLIFIKFFPSMALTEIKEIVTLPEKASAEGSKHE